MVRARAHCHFCIELPIVGQGLRVGYGIFIAIALCIDWCVRTPIDGLEKFLIGGSQFGSVPLSYSLYL
jgi:hypothetical protein